MRCAQSCLTLCNPIDCSLPGSSVHRILEARILEWVAMPSSRESSPPRDQTQVSCTAGGFFTIWATTEAPCFHLIYIHKTYPKLMKKKFLGENKAPFSPSWTKRRVGQSCTSRTGTERRGLPLCPSLSQLQEYSGSAKEREPGCTGRAEEATGCSKLFLVRLSLQLWEVSEMLKDTTILIASVHITIQSFIYYEVLFTAKTEHQSASGTFAFLKLNHLHLISSIKYRAIENCFLKWKCVAYPGFASFTKHPWYRGDQRVIQWLYLKNGKKSASPQRW